MLQLAKKTADLRAIIHVSTAYCNCPRNDIDEKFYDISIAPEKLFQIVDALDDDQLTSITPKIIGEWPNTYVFTKSVTERLISCEAKGLPIAIIRPSIVVSTAKEPIPGWIDNLYGATGIAVGAAVGLLRTLHCEPDNLADLVPVDYLVNAMIVAGWNIGTADMNKESSVEPSETPVYNYVGGVQAPLTWSKYNYLIHTSSKEKGTLPSSENGRLIITRAIFVQSILYLKYGL